VSTIRVGTRTDVLMMPQFDHLKPYTRHPYGLILPQAFTEHILGEKLASSGVTVHRPCRVVGMKANSDDVKLADVTFEDGQVITAKYIVAADGAHSTVRCHSVTVHMGHIYTWALDSHYCWHRLCRSEEWLGR